MKVTTKYSKGNLRLYKRYGRGDVYAEVYSHPNAITGGIILIHDCFGDKYYEDNSICGIDQLLIVARRYNQ